MFSVVSLPEVTSFSSYIIIPHTTKLLGGILVSLRPSVRLSVRLSHVRTVAPTVPTDPFHIYTSYLATSEGVSQVKILAKF